MLYIHIPYCHQKCTYCAFYSSATRNGRERYVEALCKEIGERAWREDDGERHAPKSIYFGGGTPSLLGIEELARIVERIKECYRLDALREVTLEANPEDLTKEYLENLTRLEFFDRLSIGVQSFSDKDLRLLNRNCGSKQVAEALENARNAGFENISIDLIYGLPGQGIEDWKENLKRLEKVAEGVTHLSSYALSVEPGTMLSKQIEMGCIASADEETVMEEYEMLLDWCGGHGFEQYEISSFSRKGKESFHNSRYWDRTPYMGLGAAAHSFDGKRRRWNVSDIEKYCDGVLGGKEYSEEEVLSPIDAHNEYVMTALRTTKGIEKERIEAQYRDVLAREMERFVKTGLIVETENRYVPTKEGLVRADGIASELFL